MTLKEKRRIDQLRHGIVPEGYKKGKLGIVPAEWDEVSFSTLFSTTSDYTDDLERYPLYSLTIEDGITAKTERYERSHLVKKENSYKVVRPDDYAYNPMNIRFGAVARHKGSKPVAVSGYYDIFTTVNECDRAFMDSFLTCGPMITYYNKVSKGSLVEKQRVHFSDFLAFSLPLPPLGERIKIAEILSAQDKVIELEQQKIEEIIKEKRFFLEKMFPQKGKTVPEIRFKGFTDPWEQRKADSLFEPLAERNDDLLPYSKTLSVATMTYKEVGNGAADSSLANYKRLRLGDIAFEGHTSKEFRYGRFVLNDAGDGIMSPRFSALRPVSELPIQFWKHYIHYEPIMERLLVNCTKAGTMMNELVVPEFLRESLLVPSTGEQMQIGQFFTTIDTLIILHQRKLEEEKRKKKALMQLLLTGLVRVNA